jgi:hypothetical protein
MKISRMKKLARFFVPGVMIMLPGLAAAQGVEQLIASRDYFNRLQDRQFDLDFRRAGAEFLGMGGASLATAHSPAAALWNPAGLAAFSRPELAFGGSFNLNTQEVTLQQFSGMKVVSEINPRLFPTFASLHYPLRWGAKSATIGVAYHQPQNFSQTTRDTFYFYPAGTTAEVEDPAGRVHAFVSSIAFALWPQLSLGLSYHYLHGSSEYQFKIQSPFAGETVFYAFQDEESYEGSFAVFGVQAELKSWLALGATLTAPWQYAITEKKEMLLAPRSVSGSVVELDTVITPAEALQKFELEMPLSYEVGVALRPSARLLLAVDFVSRPWSKIEAYTNGAPDNLDLSDGNAIRLGLEYLSQTKWAQFPLRLGYYTDPSPYRDQFFQDQYHGEQVKGGVFTLGFGVLRKDWAFQFAFETGEREYSWWLDEGDYYNERISTTKDRFNEFTFSVGYRLGSPFPSK